MKLPAFAAVALTAALASTSTPAAAQGNPHLGHVAQSFRNTPDNAGLLPAARMEADIAAQHAQLALNDRANMASIKRHTAHVLHALNPEVQESGPGKGFGLVQAARGVAMHIKLAADTEGASDNIKRHANHVATSASNVETWANDAIRHANMVMSSETASAAAQHAQIVNDLMQHILNGHDANGDGNTGWQEGEGGLAQAEQHMHLLMQGERPSH